MRPRTLEDYLALRYTITVMPCEEGGYFVEIKDLPGCMSQGETREEALEMIEEAKSLWLEVALERGIHIPLPGERTEVCRPKYLVGKTEASAEIRSSIRWEVLAA